MEPPGGSLTSALADGATDRPWWLLAAALLALATAASFYVPPPAVFGRLSDEEIGLHRLFPHVPAWWVALRLGALAAAAVVIARCARGGVSAAAAEPWPQPAPAAQYAALAAAALHVAAVPYLAQLSAAAQTVYMLWLGVPALVLVAATPSRQDQTITARIGSAAPALAVVAVWMLLRLTLAWESPRPADAVDSWRIFAAFTRFAAGNSNFLLDPIAPTIPGENGVQHFFQGLPVLQAAGAAPTLEWMQVVNALWLGAGALAVAALASLVAGPAYAAVAAAAYLFSPFVLTIQLSPLPAAAVAAPSLLALAYVRFHRRASAASLCTLAAVGGSCAGLPPLLPLTAVVMAAAAWHRLRAAAPSRVVAATALLTFLAAFLPSVPAPQTLRTMRSLYVSPSIPFGIAERALLGQMTPTTADWLGEDTRAPLKSEGDAEPLAAFRPRHPVRKTILVALGALLAPFATARSAVRLWPDVIFDPLTIALLTAGLAVCARAAIRSATARAVLLMLAVSLVPGLTSSYDLPSLLRLFPIVVPVALLAAIGLRTLHRRLAPSAAPGKVAGAAVAMIAAGGCLMFDVLGPAVLPESSLGLTARSVDADSARRAVVLTAHGRDRRRGIPIHQAYLELDWLREQHPYITEVLAQVPPAPIPIVDIDTLAAEPERDLLFWSPALEQSAAVTAAVCARWPHAVLHTLTDRSGLSHAHAARVGERDWQPLLPRQQWSSVGCPAPS